MKKLLLINLFVLFLSVLSVNSQTITDESGARAYRANVAVIVKESIFSFENGKFVHSVSDADKSLFGAAVNTLVIKYLQDEGFRVVNRDNEAYIEIQNILKENKLEDYLKGYSVQAKGQGADWILLADISLFNKDNYISADFSYRFINVQNNVCIPAKLQRSQVISSENDMQNFAQNLISDNSNFFLDYMRRLFPALFSVIETKGSNVTLAALQPIGVIREDEKIYVYKYSKGQGTIEGRTLDYDILDLVSATDKYKLDKRGYLVANVGTSIKDPNTIVASLAAKNSLASESYLQITYADLDYNESTYEGYVRKMINQAVYGALGNDSRFYIIENTLLDEVKDERNLQKTEEFIDGHTVEQFKAIGADEYVTVSNVVVNEKEESVSFNVNLYNVSSNTLTKTIPCNTPVSKVFSSAKSAVSQFFITPCEIVSIDKKEMDVYIPLGFRVNEGQKYYLALTKETTNPINGETSYQRINVATLKYSVYKGMLHTLIIEDVLDKKVMNNLDDYIGKNNFALREIYDEKISDNGEVKEKKGGGFGNFLKNVADVLDTSSTSTPDTEAQQRERLEQIKRQQANPNSSELGSKVQGELDKISNELKKFKVR